jgi:uncharacterized protein YjaG (DUF416 family)
MNAKEIEFEISDEAYRDLLDEIYGDVTICGMKFSSGRALQELDPIAFNCGKVDYESGEPSKWVCEACAEEFDSEHEANECCANGGN